MIEPKVFLIASTKLHNLSIDKWMKEVGGSACLNHLGGSDGEILIELAGRNCYKSFAVGLNPNITKVRTDSKAYHENILKSRHGSVLEHASATFAFENVSRVFTHELVRHRAGMAFSQQSLRYVRLDQIKIWIPPEIREAGLTQLFLDGAAAANSTQSYLADKLSLDELSMSQKKKLTSAFRRLAPMGLATSIVATFNMRALRWVIQMRTAESSETEIRTVFCKVYEIAKEEWPMLFQDFIAKTTDDGLFEAIPSWGKV